jgi:hypothetical protein
MPSHSSDVGPVVEVEVFGEWIDESEELPRQEGADCHEMLHTSNGAVASLGTETAGLPPCHAKP